MSMANEKVDVDGNHDEDIKDTSNTNKNTLPINDDKISGSNLNANSDVPVLDSMKVKENYNSIQYQGSMNANQTGAANVHFLSSNEDTKNEQNEQQQQKERQFHTHTIDLLRDDQTMPAPQNSNLQQPIPNSYHNSIIQNEYDTNVSGHVNQVDGFHQEYYDPVWDEHHDSNANDGTLHNGSTALSKCIHSCTETYLQRSFCFGAIDGLLTGSSITFAASGLGIIAPASPLKDRVLMIALTFAACAADGLCMAIGHVWSTYIMNENRAKELEEHMQNFKFRRGETKAKLVDLLLMRGMLKIDAMSIADTLEGYPDMFMGALVGDMMITTPIANNSNDFGVHENGYRQPHYPMNNNYSYSFDDGEADYHDYKADAESRGEALVMMLAFSFFSAIPPFVFSFIPNMINPPQEHVDQIQKPSYYDPYIDYGNHPQPSVSVDTGISPTSVTVSILSCIMLFLGIWKR